MPSQPPEESLLASLNADTSTLFDLLRHHANEPTAIGSNPHATTLTPTHLTLTYTQPPSPTSHTLKIALPTPTSSKPLDTRLKQLTYTARHSRIPVRTFPHAPQTYFLLLLLTAEALICLAEPAAVPAPLRTPLETAQRAVRPLFETRQALRLFFLFTMVVHLLEGLYAVTLIRRAVDHASFGGARAAAWAVQTAVVGFPSLFLLMEQLAARSPPHLKAH